MAKRNPFGMLGAFQPSYTTKPGTPVFPTSPGQSIVNSIRSGTHPTIKMSRNSSGPRRRPKKKNTRKA